MLQGGATEAERVIGCPDHGGLLDLEVREIVASSAFANSVLITECNQPVCLYGQVRAQHFARSRAQQLFWVQAEDFPIAGSITTHSAAAMDACRSTWLRRHDKETGGIMNDKGKGKPKPHRETKRKRMGK